LKKIIIILSIILFPFIGKAQDDTVNFKYQDYALSSKYDTAGYCSVLTVTKNGTVIFTSNCNDRVMSISAEDLNNDGKKEILIEQYTGGAHCCSYLLACSLVNDNFKVLDSLWWGNAGYEIKDMNNDGRKELVGVSDYFAYAFTNYSQSFYPIVIYKFKNNKFYDATSEFPNEVTKHIGLLKDELKDYIAKGFACPKAGEDTFNTDAGAVKAILGPIVACYKILGKVDEGYDYVKKIYKCNDMVNFIAILKKDYKLK
jgi:hypothetical protein